MDVKLYIEREGNREALDERVELQNDLVWSYGVKVISNGTLKTLAREQLKGERYSYSLREPHGGTALQGLMDSGERFNLVVAYGETRNVGRRRAFTPFETYIIRHLVPRMRVITRANYVELIAETLEVPERENVAGVA